MLKSSSFKYKTAVPLEERKSISADLLSNNQFKNHSLIIIEPYSQSEKLPNARDFEQFDRRNPGWGVRISRPSPSSNRCYWEGGTLPQTCRSHFSSTARSRMDVFCGWCSVACWGPLHAVPRLRRPVPIHAILLHADLRIALSWPALHDRLDYLV